MVQEVADEDAEEGPATKTAEGGFVRGGVTYKVGDCFYVPPDTFEQIEDPDAVKPEVPAYVAKSRFHKGGANAGLRAFGVAKLLSLKKAQGQVRRPSGAPQCRSSAHSSRARLGMQSSTYCLPRVAKHSWRRRCWSACTSRD